VRKDKIYDSKKKGEGRYAMFLLPIYISEKSQSFSETSHSSKIPKECIKNVKS
jgi:hypothetical protein